MPPTYYTTSQLASASGYSIRTIREHIKQKFITPVEKEKLPGVKGMRFTKAAAERWLGVFKPSKQLTH